MRDATLWRLFVDESGTFEGARTPLANRGGESGQRVVAGLLVAGESLAANELRLRRALEAVAPWVPWPLHASDLRRPVFHALWARGARERAPEVAWEAWALLERVMGGQAREVADELERRGRMSHERVAPLWLALAGADGELSARLTSLGERVRREVVDVVRALGGGVATSGLPPATAFAAAEAAPLEQPASALPGRYLPLLELLLERVTDALVAGGGGPDRPAHHRVEVRALVRDVVEDQLGRFAPLHVRHLNDAAVQVAGPRRTRTVGRVKVDLLPASVARFDRDVSAHLVVADLVANASLGPLGERREPLSSVADRVERKAGLATAMAPGRTHLAAGGAARLRVREARGGELTTAPLPGEVRRWAAEQADAWAAVVADWAGGAQ